MKLLHVSLGFASLTAGVFVACGGGNNASVTPTASPLSSGTVGASSPSATASLEAVIGNAYVHYWDVYADAAYNLDETHLGEAMTGSELTRTQQELEGLRQRGRAAKIVVKHNYFVANVDDTAGTATVHDQYTNSSYEVDAATHAIVGGPATDTVLDDTYFLVKEGGVWKVQDGVRQGP